MHAPATGNQEFEFVKQLARDLARGDIKLPSFPAVVVRIRGMLEDEACDFAQVGKVVSADAVLVSRLFVFANSAYHNRSGEKVASLEAAIARLGLELVRNTALSLAVKQLMLAEKHKSVVGYVRNIWARSMRIASLSFALAELSDDVNEESAFMCGLLHEIGMLYILTKAKDFPDFLGDDASLKEVLNEWHTQVGRSIVEAWGFPKEVVQSMDPVEFLNEHTHVPAAPVDAVYAATRLLDISEDDWSGLVNLPACQKLNVNEESLPRLVTAYRDKLASVQQSLA